jgi:dTDP-4-dehydrorhamnose 3,5-epimerase
VIFEKTPIPGVWILEVEKRADDRGFFGRAWCRREFEAQGLASDFPQANIGYSVKRGTVRGLHFQKHPWQEVKIVRCTRGAMFDVVVDLRPDSPSYTRWFGVELTQDSHRLLYVPEGCAQGYQTLVDETEMSYQTSTFYAPDSAAGVRFDDPAFGIEWPLPVSVISEADRTWPSHVGD